MSEIFSSNSQIKSFWELNKWEGGCLLMKLKRNTVHVFDILDCQITDLRAYLISGSINVFESLYPLGFSFRNNGYKTCHYFHYDISYFYIWLYYKVGVLLKNNKHGHLPPTGSKNKNQIDIMDILQKAKLNIF